MLVLAIDTSSAEGSVALLEAAADGTASDAAPRLLGERLLSGARYAESLLPVIADLLAASQRGKQELSLLVVASGPGSFTGLRVAIATAKGLAEVLQTPVVAVSVLEAVSAAVGEGRAIAALDAHRNEIFYGEYTLRANQPGERHHESIAAIAAFAEALAAQPAHAPVITPDENVAAALSGQGIAAQQVARPLARDYARIGLVHFAHGRAANAATLDANYLRRSDAEVFVAPKLGIPVR